MLKRVLRRVTASGWSVTDAIDLAGLACLDGAAWWFRPIVGLIGLGAALLFVGWAVDR
jgi:hypothetical protein